MAYEAAREETRNRADRACVEAKAAQTSASWSPEASLRARACLRPPARVGQPRSISILELARHGFDRGTAPQRTRSESAGVAKGEPCRRATSASAWDPMAHASPQQAAAEQRAESPGTTAAWIEREKVLKLCQDDAQRQAASISLVLVPFFLATAASENDGDAE